MADNMDIPYQDYSFSLISFNLDQFIVKKGDLANKKMER